MSNNLGPQQLSLTNKRTAPTEPSPKGQSESLELVRSKLRESLAASLALGSQAQNKPLAVEKSPQSEAASTPRQAHVESQQAESASTSVDATSCRITGRALETSISSTNEFDQNHNNGGQSSSHDNSINGNIIDPAKLWKCDGQEFLPKHVSLEDEAMFSNNFVIKDELLQGHGLCWASDLELGGVEMIESRDPKRPKLTPDDSTGLEVEQVLPSPQALAIKIEAELFKLFGGVNKKYKEKGRSLLFNLKDRNNPELKERVLSGDIPPDRLCSMTAEELASKELSEWRIAKAEEFAQMVVLPDSEVDIRRLVKKTHKGEFQVEVERDDSVSVEVAVGASSLSQIPSKTNGTATQIPSKPAEPEAQIPSKANETGASEGAEGAAAPEKVVDSRDQAFPSNVITLSHDASDFMQGFMEDELKDAEFLPPIVSLDEFMESLDSEPPFENLQQVSGQDIPVSADNNSDSLGSKLDSLKVGSTDPVKTSSDKPDQVDAKYTRTNSILKDAKDTRTDGNLKDAKDTITDTDLKSGDIHIESETSHPDGENKGEHVWEGLLQLNVSAMVTVIGFFKSGEKTSAKDWPNFLEIKGRVRLDAFEKFLQELPMSRSRAIMVVHFCWKEGSPESGRLHLSEVSDSYVADERVGFAEPAPAVELYFCPPHVKMIEMLSRHLPKDHTEILNAIDDGLIGIVVWRKPPVTSSISPKMSSYQRQNSKRQHFSSKKQQERDGNVKQSVPPLPNGPPPSNPDPPSDDDNIDDIPPGFGPAVARDDDDLPEFDFVKNTKPLLSQFPSPNPSRGSGMGQIRPSIRPHQMQQMRELVHKYGQGKTSANPANWQSGQGFGIETQPWNDDDDIPEWQPDQENQQPPPPPPPLHGFQQQTLPAHLVNQQLGPMPSQPLVPPGPPLPIPLQPLPSQMGPTQGAHATVQPSWQSGPWRAPPFGSNGPPDMGNQGNGSMQPLHFGGPPVDGQFYNTPRYRAGPNGMSWRQDIPRSRGT
ncbi:uncharacterized protein LOC131255057 [Magnolia sinica]|uniref:uncharacterized protein LOC131255057 n=1 Tax=Magnolia sinica TaxID=86752 RepID=UPI002659EC25|nr:uncharacterized protein LOC131255057 [Magnolia sinica]